MRTRRLWCGWAVLTVWGMTVGAPLTLGCSSSYMPTARDVAQGAELIVVARIIDKRPVSSSPTEWQLDVERVIKGDSPSPLTVTDIRTSLCGDEMAAREGDLIVLGLNYAPNDRSDPPEDRVLDAYWRFADDGSLIDKSSPAVDEGHRSLDDVLQALGALPNTATRPRPSWLPGAAAIILATAALGGASIGHRLNRRRT